MNTHIIIYASEMTACNSKFIYKLHRASHLDKKNQFLSGLFLVVCLCLSPAGGGVTGLSSATAILQRNLDCRTSLGVMNGKHENILQSTGGGVCIWYLSWTETHGHVIKGKNLNRKWRGRRKTRKYKEDAALTSRHRLGLGSQMGRRACQDCCGYFQGTKFSFLFLILREIGDW